MINQTAGADEFLIYGLVDPNTLLARYVGLSSSGLYRPKTHTCPCRLMARTHCAAWLRQLNDRGLKPTIVVLEVCEEHDLNQLERWWIAFGRACGWPLTNLTDGGSTQQNKSRKPLPAETRAKISAANKGKGLGDSNPAKRPEVRNKISASSRGIKRARTAAHNAKIAAARLGKKHSAEAKAIMRMKALARPAMSTEARAKCSKASLRRWGRG